MKWFELLTFNNKLRFKSARLNYPNCKDSWIVTEPDNPLESQMSVTNDIESVIAHHFIGAWGNSFKLFQYCEGEGVFELSFKVNWNGVVDANVKDIRWTKIANDLRTFEALYGK